MNNKMPLIIVLSVFVLLALFWKPLDMLRPYYIVDETEQVVITQFGQPVGSATTKPGIYFKTPFMQKANYFSKNLLERNGEAGQINTLDKTYIWIDTFARWKIVDPLKFFQNVSTEKSAHTRLDDIVDSAVRNLITQYSLIETVKNTDRKMEILEFDSAGVREVSATVTIKMGREKIIAAITEQARPKLEKLGIELVDVKIKRLNYSDEVRNSVYNRMIAERKRIAEKFRSEGQGEARKIEGDMEKELKRITSEAYRKAQEVRGKADGEATRLYADSLGRDPEFYSFVQTLEIYKTALDKESSLILTTDSEFLKYFKGYQGKRTPTP